MPPSITSSLPTVKLDSSEEEHDGFRDPHRLAEAANQNLAANAVGDAVGLSLLHPELAVDGCGNRSRAVALMPAFHMADIDVLAMYPGRRHLSSRVRVMIN